MSEIGLYLGRFQPLHNGHAWAIEWILERCEKLYIVVGSAQTGNEKKNPFTYEERKKMLVAFLRSRKLLSRCTILPLPDFFDNDKWFAELTRIAPDFTVAFSNNSIVIDILRSKKKKILPLSFFEKTKNEGTRIRKRMIFGDKWKSCVPSEVEKIILAIGGIKRVRNLEKTAKREAKV